MQQELFCTKNEEVFRNPEDWEDWEDVIFEKQIDYSFKYEVEK